jgi:hypothetical protein
VVVLVVVGLVLTERWRAFGLLALLPLAYLPNLVIADDWPTARSMVALVPVIVVLAVRAVEG